MRMLILSALVALQCAGALAQTAPAATAKDVVLASLAPAPAAENGAAQPARADSMVVSVLVEGPFGMLLPRSTDATFVTGERFRIKLLAPRDAEVLFYNTNPAGQTASTPLWRGNIKGGVETLSDMLELSGSSGEDQLHIVLQPRVPEANPYAWFHNLWGNASGRAGKDIRLVTESTPQSTYFYNPNGQGGYLTVRIRH